MQPETIRGKRLVMAVTGASGAIYSMRFLKAVLELGLEVDLVVSDYGKRLLIEECELNLKSDSIDDWLDRRYGKADRPGTVEIHGEREMGAAIASGSRHWLGMIVIPCTVKTLAGIAGGHASNLIERAADVTLKEQRRLVLVLREAPLNVIQIENMLRAARAGAVILPAMPAFYYGPKSFEDLADFIVGRALSLLDLPHRLFKPWKS